MTSPSMKATPARLSAAFTVSLSTTSTKQVQVNYATADGTAKAGSDYASISGTLTFSPGEKKKTVIVQVVSKATGAQ